MQRLTNNRIVLWLIGLVALFYALQAIFVLDTLIYLLNSLFAGAMLAVVVAFGPLLLNAIKGVRPYDRVRQMTIGFFLAWVAFTISVSTSIYVRSADLAVTSSIMTALSRYVAVFGAVLQITAPDFGLGIFHGRERKTLWTALTAGGAFAAVMFVMQKESVLKPLVNAEHFLNLALAAYG